MLKTVSIIVSGRVQGVFFRASAKDIATALGIKGEIRNRKDDTVHIIATGYAEQLEQLTEWCRQGPPKAKVTNVIVEEMILQVFEKFTIVR